MCQPFAKYPNIQIFSDQIDGESLVRGWNGDWKPKRHSNGELSKATFVGQWIACVFVLALVIIDSFVPRIYRKLF